MTMAPVCAHERIGDEDIFFRHYNGQLEHRVLFIHGAGKANSARMKYIAEYLAKKEIMSIMFDHSGHGNSTGELSNSSLGKRFLEAQFFVRKYEPTSIICSSMGGHTALQIMKHHALKKAVFFAPGLFRDDSDHVTFGPEWSKRIREPESYRNSRVPFDAKLESTDILHIQGSEDTVIPRDIISEYKSVAGSARNSFFLGITGAPHNIHDWVRENDAKREFILANILALHTMGM